MTPYAALCAVLAGELTLDEALELEGELDDDVVATMHDDDDDDQDDDYDDD